MREVYCHKCRLKTHLRLGKCIHCGTPLVSKTTMGIVNGLMFTGGVACLLCLTLYVLR